MEEKVIVLADKAAAVRKKISASLEKKGYRVITASDGIEALQKTVTSAPHLLLVNYALPGMNGYILSHILKSDHNFKALPVVIMASKKDRIALEKIRLRGDEIIDVSLNTVRLLETVEKILGYHETSRKMAPLKKIADHKSLAYLMERMTNLMERDFLEDGILEELRALLLRNLGFEPTAEIALQILNRAISYNGAAVCVNVDSRGKMLIKLNKAFPEEYLEKIKVSMLERFAGKGRNFGPTDLDIKVMRSYGQNETPAHEKLHFFGEPIIVDEVTKGVIGLILPSANAKHEIEERAPFFRALFELLHKALEDAYTREQYLLLSTTDSLTLVNNRCRIIDMLKKELVRAKRYFLDLSVIMFDIDNFKTINDFYGYQVGDLILKDLAKIATETMRSIDEVGRYGGEEFLIILPETNLKSAGVAGNRLKARVQGHVFPGIAKDIKVTLSIGVTSYLRDIDISVDDILRRIDQSLSEAKRMGKNYVHVMSK
jgi:diguanylate cyclase (GGDEF)-like protein